MAIYVLPESLDSGFGKHALLHKKVPDCTSTNATGAAAPVPLLLEKTA
jgi:hypothetical protein